MSFPYAQQNSDSRRRLEALVSGLSDADLVRATDYGWTVAALLAHLAFWDHRMSVILHRWQEDGFDPSPIDSMAVNDALKVLCHALAPRTAVQLAVSAADKVDAEFATLSAEYVKEIEQYTEENGIQFRMNRSLHRNAHLDDIELLLQQKR